MFAEGLHATVRLKKRVKWSASSSCQHWETISSRCPVWLGWKVVVLLFPRTSVTIGVRTPLAFISNDKFTKVAQKQACGLMGGQSNSLEACAVL